MDQKTLMQAAAKIREEMVCCDTYDQLAKYFNEAEYRALKRSKNYHAICHYGEWAARIVEKLAMETPAPPAEQGWVEVPDWPGYWGASGPN